MKTLKKVDNIIAPEEVIGTTNTSLLEKIASVAVYLLILAVCVGLLVMSS